MRLMKKLNQNKSQTYGFLFLMSVKAVKNHAYY